MIDRLMPIFAVIGMLSSLVYIGLAAWIMLSGLGSKKQSVRDHISM